MIGRSHPVRPGGPAAGLVVAPAPWGPASGGGRRPGSRPRRRSDRPGLRQPIRAGLDPGCKSAAHRSPRRRAPRPTVGRRRVNTRRSRAGRCRARRVRRGSTRSGRRSRPRAPPRPGGATRRPRPDTGPPGPGGIEWPAPRWPRRAAPVGGGLRPGARSRARSGPGSSARGRPASRRTSPAPASIRSRARRPPQPSEASRRRASRRSDRESRRGRAGPQKDGGRRPGRPGSSGRPPRPAGAPGVGLDRLAQLPADRPGDPLQQLQGLGLAHRVAPRDRGRCRPGAAARAGWTPATAPPGPATANRRAGPGRGVVPARRCSPRAGRLRAAMPRRDRGRGSRRPGPSRGP